MTNQITQGPPYEAKTRTLQGVWKRADHGDGAPHPQGWTDRGNEGKRTAPARVPQKQQELESGPQEAYWEPLSRTKGGTQDWTGRASDWEMHVRQTPPAPGGAGGLKPTHPGSRVGQSWPGAGAPHPSTVIVRDAQERRALGANVCGSHRCCSWSIGQLLSSQPSRFFL